MASLKEIRAAVKTTLAANISGLHCYDRIQDAANVPCVIVAPDIANFDAAMGRGTDTWNLTLYVLVAKTENNVAQDQLDDYLTGAGAKSIRQVIFTTRGLGLADGTDAHVSGMSNYDSRYPMAQVDHIGAELSLVVHTKGKP